MMPSMKWISREEGGRGKGGGRGKKREGSLGEEKAGVEGNGGGWEGKREEKEWRIGGRKRWWEVG